MKNYRKMRFSEGLGHATHMQLACNTHATHMQHTCNTLYFYQFLILKYIEACCSFQKIY
jgi:hypothetical protein